jgi:hypothetical protein
MPTDILTTEQFEAVAPFLLLCGPAALLLALYIGFRFFSTIGKVRKESRHGFEAAKHIQEDYAKACAEDDEERRRLMERYEAMERELRDRVAHSETLSVGTRDRLLKLEQYLKEFFEVELKSVFDSFDKTVASILEEMKAELLRGVDRIEEIQAVVDSKSLAQERILEGDGSVYRMIAETSPERLASAGAEPGPEHGGAEGGGPAGPSEDEIQLEEGNA